MNARVFDEFFAKEASGGLVLIGGGALALIAANTPLADIYFALLHEEAAGLPVEAWINDALMAVFFLLVGLEIKRELFIGELSSWQSRALPCFAALGGVAVPALVYLAINAHSFATMNGWAIPTATDIAFSLGILALLGSRVPTALKLFLTALAILDDLAAVIIIAGFYTSGLSLGMLALAVFIVALLVLLNRLRVSALWPYLLLGVALWIVVFRSGVHPTIAGVLLAFTIPIGSEDRSPLERLEHLLQRPVAFLVLPLFAFANAGVAFGSAGGAVVFHPVALGIAVGLFVGKQIGVFGGVLIALQMGFARLPEDTNVVQVYGVAILCGVGFTMSLFIADLAFASTFHDETRIGVLAGSLLSAVAGALVLIVSARRAKS